MAAVFTCTGPLVDVMCQQLCAKRLDRDAKRISATVPGVCEMFPSALVYIIHKRGQFYASVRSNETTQGRRALHMAVH